MNTRSLLLLVALTIASPLTAQEPDDSRLVRILTGRNETIRMRTIAGLESDRATLRASLADLVIVTETLAQSTASDDLVSPSLVRLIQLIGSVDNDLSEQGLIQLLNSKHSGIAMIAADTLGKHQFHGAIDFLKQQTNRPEYASNYAFRFNLIRALIRMEQPDAIEFVTDQSRTLDGQLKHKIDEVLADVTVDYFDGDQTRFDQWQQSRQKGSGIFKQASDEPESLSRVRLTKNQYYGIDIHAKRLMFIIDRSGSMNEYGEGLTRLDRAKSELIQALEQLPPETEFALLFFNSDIGAWREHLVPATEENKKEAIQYVRRLRSDSFTNTYGALRKALEFDDTLEAVFLLTDGRPTTGDIVHPNRIVDDILHRNRFRHLNFSTIGIAVEGPTEMFLKTLAVETGGEYRAAN